MWTAVPSVWSWIRASCCADDRRRGAARGADAPRAGARSVRRHRSVLHRSRGDASGVRPRRTDLRRGPCVGWRGGAAGERPGDRSTNRSDRLGGRIRGGRSAACGAGGRRWARALLNPRTRTSPTVLRSSSPPRRWAGRAGTGGLRTDRGCSSPASMSRGCGAGTSPIPPIPNIPRSRSRTRRQGPTTPRSHCTSSTSSARRRCEVRWDRAGFEYLTGVDWSEHGLLIVVQSRDQRTMRILDVDASTGATSVLREDTDDAWVDIVDGVPASAGGRDARLDRRSRWRQATAHRR